MQRQKERLAALKKNTCHSTGGGHLPESMEVPDEFREAPEHVLTAQRLAVLCPEPMQLLPSCTSTNDLLKAMEDAPDGMVLVTGCQTGGRGRLGRRFASPEGGVYLSILLRPEVEPQKLLHLTAMSAVAMRRAVFDCCGVEAELKWVNDLIAGGKKLCGILTEWAGTDRVIIGIGVNCNTAPDDFPPEVRPIATSLRELTGGPVDPNALAGAMAFRLRQMRRVLLTEKAAWMAEYAAACVTVGKPVQLLRGDSREEAFAEGIDEDGGLIVRLKSGQRTTVNSGEVSVRGLYGYV